MAPLSQASAQILCAEILADARRESEEIVRRAQEQAESVLTKAAEEADRLRKERLAQARAEAARRTELILATVAVEAERLRVTRIQTLLQSICDEARERLLALEGFDYRQALLGLGAGALGQMAGEAFTVKLSPADRVHFGAGLAEEILHRIGHSSLTVQLAEDPAIIGGGLIVEDSGGHQVWDNRFTARVERLWPELRRQVALQTGLVTSNGAGGGRP